MCDECKKLEAKIEHYRKLSVSITDEMTLQGITLLIKIAEQEKTELHPGAQHFSDADHRQRSKLT